MFNEFKFKTKVWLYPGHAGWHFVTIDEKLSAEIKKEFGYMKRGWGSLPVKARIGNTSWNTSIFPTKEATYLLAIKAEVRKKESILADDLVEVTVEVLT